MPQVLTDGATIICAHGGQLGVTGVPLLTVTIHRYGVLTANTVMGQSMKAPPAPQCTPPAPATPCKHCVSVSATPATKLAVNGKPVLLQSPTIGTTDGTAVVLTLTAIETQTKLMTL